MNLDVPVVYCRIKQDGMLALDEKVYLRTSRDREIVATTMDATMFFDYEKTPLFRVHESRGSDWNTDHAVNYKRVLLEDVMGRDIRDFYWHATYKTDKTDWGEYMVRLGTPAPPERSLLYEPVVEGLYMISQEGFKYTYRCVHYKEAVTAFPTQALPRPALPSPLTPPPKRTLKRKHASINSP